MIETVRISPAAKDQLVTLKRRTGLKHWNELCRWALCRSLAEPGTPPDSGAQSEVAIEIEWRTFAGRAADLYLDLLRQRCVDDGLTPDARTVERQLALHLHRGIGYLAGDPALGKPTEGTRSRRGTGVRALVASALATVGDGGDGGRR